MARFQESTPRSPGQENTCLVSSCDRNNYFFYAGVSFGLFWAKPERTIAYEGWQMP